MLKPNVIMSNAFYAMCHYAQCLLCSVSLCSMPFMQCVIMPNAFYAAFHYAQCWLSQLSSFSLKSLCSSVIMLNVVMLNVVAPSRINIFLPAGPQIMALDAVGLRLEGQRGRTGRLLLRPQVVVLLGRALLPECNLRQRYKG